MSALFNIDIQDEDFCTVQRKFTCFEVGRVLFHDSRYETFINGPESATPLLFHCYLVGSNRMLQLGLGVVRDADKLEYGGLWMLSENSNEDIPQCIAFTESGAIDMANTPPSAIDFLCTNILGLELKYRDVVLLCAQHYYSMMVYRVYLAACYETAVMCTDDLAAIERVNAWRKIEIVLRASAAFVNPQS